MTALQDAKAQAEAGADIFEKLKKGTDPADSQGRPQAESAQRCGL